MKKLLLFSSLWFLFILSSAQNRYWVATGTTTAVWSNTVNWSTSSGGAGGASVPTSTATVMFNGAGTAPCNIDISVAIQGLTTTTAYPGTITQNSYTITIGSSGASLSGGSFTGGTGPVTVASNFILSGAAFTSTSGILTLQDDYNFSSGTFTHNSGKVKCITTSSLTGSSSFYDLEFSPTSSATFRIASTTTLTVNGVLTLSGSANLTLNTGSIDAKGDITITNTGTAGGGTTRIKINGTGRQTLTGSGTINNGKLSRVSIDKSSDSLILAGVISVNNDWTYTQGAINAHTNNSTVVFTRSLTITGSHSLYKALFTSSTNATYTIESGTLTVTNTLKTDGSGTINIDGTCINAKGDITILNTGTSGGGTATININGTTRQTLTGSGTVLAGRLCNITIDKSADTLVLASIITVRGDWTYSQGIVDPGTSQVIFIGGTTKSISGSHSFYDLVFYPSTSGCTYTIPSTNTLTVNHTLTFDANASGAVAINSGKIYARGNITINTLGAGGGSATIYINGTGDQTLTGSGIAAAGQLPNVIIDKSSGTLYLNSLISVRNGWTYLQGTIDYNTYDNTMFLGRKIDGSHSLKNVNLYTNMVSSFSLTAGTVLTVENLLTVSGSADIIIHAGAGASIDAKKDITVTGGNTPSDVPSDGYIRINGTGDQVFTGNATGIGSVQDIRINKPSGTLILKEKILVWGNWRYEEGTIDAQTYNSTVDFRYFSSINGSHTLHNVNFTNTGNGGSSVSISLSNTLTATGTLDINCAVSGAGGYAGRVCAKGDILFSGTADNSSPSTCTLVIAGTGDQTLTGCGVEGSGNLYNVVIDKPSGTLLLTSTISCAGKWTYLQGNVDPGTSTVCFYGNYDIDCEGTSSGMAFNHVKINTNTRTMKGALAANGAITIASGARLNNGSGSYNVTIGGNWINNGVYTQSLSTVTLNGSSEQLIQGSTATTFYNLSLAGSGKKTLGKNTTVSNTLALGASELYLDTYDLTLSSSASTLTQTTGFISNNGTQGTITRKTSSLSPVAFPLGYAAENVHVAVTPGKTAAQAFTTRLNNNTGITVIYDKTLHATGPSTVTIAFATTSYDTVKVRIAIDNSASITTVQAYEAGDGSYKNMPAGAYTLSGGNQLTLHSLVNMGRYYAVPALLTLPVPGYNSTYVVEYGADDVAISEQIQFYDLLGRPTQAQVRDMATNEIIVSQTLYDAYGRAALQTLPAPAASTALGYKTDFIKDASGNNYDYNNFDITATLNNPDAVANATAGTLGNYYSNSGSEAFVPTTAYPYLRMEFTSDPASRPKRSAKAGNEFKMGSGHETRSFTMISGNELNKIFGSNALYKAVLGADPLTSTSYTVAAGNITAVKTLAIDAGGKEMITYSCGGLAIASCYSGLSTPCATHTITGTLYYNGTRSADIHLPAAQKTTLKLPVPLTVSVTASDITHTLTDLNTNFLLVENTHYQVNIDRTVTFLSSYTVSTSLVLRVSYAYTPTYLASIGSNTPPDATVEYNLDYSQWSLNYYDLAGRLRKTVSPKGIDCSSPGTFTMVTTYDYSSMGQLVAHDSPDEGKKEYVYDTEGKLRFSQNEVQRALNQFSYTNYDVHGRPYESGLYTTSTTAAGSVYFQNYYATYTLAPGGCTTCSATAGIINTTDGLRDADCSDVINTYYYTLADAEKIPSVYTYTANYQPKYLLGQVSKTAKRNVSSSEVGNQTWYSYDHLGRTAFTVQQILDEDFISAPNTYTISSPFKTNDYTYDLNTGLLLEQTYQQHQTSNPNEYLKHRFVYDENLKLSETYTQQYGESEQQQCAYSYYKTGALKRKEIGNNLQGIDYVYTINGDLKSMNHPSLSYTLDPGQDGYANSFAQDLFAETIDYHHADYTRTGSNILSSSTTTTVSPGYYNGLINAVRWKTRSITNGINNGADYIAGTGGTQILTGTATEAMYRYSYDELYRLSTATFGIFSNTASAGAGLFTADASNNYKEFGTTAAGGIGYDANGNITRLKRNGYNAAGLLMDDFTYTYTDNKLTAIRDDANSTWYYTDFDASGLGGKSFTYNAIGQMTAGEAEFVDSIKYDVRGKVSKVYYQGGISSHYYYNERGIKEKVRITGFSGDLQRTWYVTDAAGNVQGIYNQDLTTYSITLTEQPVYAADRMGVLDKTTNTINYELTDHLGSVRVTFKAVNTGSVVISSWQDNYAFGSTMPGRSYYDGPVYRYNYQGQEDAAASSWKNFELRQLNSDLGRWMAPDPYGQFASPYIAMGNIPTVFTDPDGGQAIYTGKPDALKQAMAAQQLINAWHMEIYGNSDWMDDGGDWWAGGGGVSSGWDTRSGAEWSHDMMLAEMDAELARLSDNDVDKAIDLANKFGSDASNEFIGGVQNAIANGANYDNGVLWKANKAEGFTDYVETGTWGAGNYSVQKVNGVKLSDWRPVSVNIEVGGDEDDGLMSRSLDWILAGGPVIEGPYIGGTAPDAAFSGISGLISGVKGLFKTAQLTSKARTAEKGLSIGERFLKKGYVETHPGVFRSADNLRQFRMTDSDILNATPHFNFEIFSPDNLRIPMVNFHMPIK